MAEVVVLIGSSSDLGKVEPCLKQLETLGIQYMAAISSAHRSPDRTERLVRENADARVFICAAGMAAHLAGAVAARTIRPVIGLPLSSPALAGMDALFSTAQMPSGFPVATVAIDGARNAAWLAAEILAINDGALRARIEAAREAMRGDIEKASENLRA